MREAVRLAPSNIAYHKLLGQALMKNPRWRKQAEGHFHRVLEIEPYDVESYLELAVIYKETGLHMRAKKMYEQVLALDPDHELASEKLSTSDTPAGTALFRRLIGKDVAPQ